MNEWFRYVRLGMIDVFGITIPGVLLIVFALGGFLVPVTCLIIPVTQAFADCQEGSSANYLLTTWEANKTFILLLGIVLAYMLGYILRLVSPNRLDKVSASHVIAEMEKTALGMIEKDHWPIQDVSHDKFPYLNLRHYLEYRGHTELASLIPWGPEEDKKQKKSSTHIQTMKLRVLLKEPELAALLDSKEAHIRLLSGTWGAIRSTRWFVYAGLVISLIGIVVSCVSQNHEVFRPHVYAGCLLVTAALVMAMEWCKNTIERLFHYQRVRELFLIVASAYQVKEEGRATPGSD